MGRPFSIDAYGALRLWWQAGSKESDMTRSEAKAIARSLGFSLSYRNGEYRLAPRGTTPSIAEAQAYYTDDLGDAIDTARFIGRMAVCRNTLHEAMVEDFRISLSRSLDYDPPEGTLEMAGAMHNGKRTIRLA